MVKKYKSKNEFRYNYNTKHMNYVFEEYGKKYHSLGLTHHKKTFGKKNMPLFSNPKKNSKEKAYVRNGIITDKTDNYSYIDKRFSFSSRDKANVKSIIRKYKAKRRYR